MGKTPSQKRWLQRHVNDPYVHKARASGYRSRAAFKLLEMQEKHRLFRKGQRILDLGAAPGSWAQIAVQCGARVTAIDLLPIEPLEHVTCIQADFRTLTYTERYDGIISDVAPSSTGVGKIDHLKLVGMIEEMLPIVDQCLKPGGFFVCKVFKGGMGNELWQEIKRRFGKVVVQKPKASRPESPEEYWIGLQYKGAPV